jgi:hypothetical protein
VRASQNTNFSPLADTAMRYSPLGTDY